MQPYFDQTRKTASQKKLKTTFKKMKNGRQPQKKWKTTSKKMEDNLKFKAVLLRLFNNKNLKNKWV